MSLTLFNLSDEILALEADLDQEEITDEQRDALIDAWLEAQAGAKDKIDHYAGMIRELNARADARSAEAERLSGLATVDQNKANRLKSRLKLYFERHKLARFETPRFNLSIQANGGKLGLVFPQSWESEPSSAPERYRKNIPALDKEAMRADAEHNEQQRAALWERFKSEEIGEAELQAGLSAIESGDQVRLAPRGTQIRIR